MTDSTPAAPAVDAQAAAAQAIAGQAVAAQAQRPRKPQTFLTVLRTERVTPRTIRLVLGGPGFAEFRPNEHTDMYVKLVFTPSGGVPAEKVDIVEARRTLPPEDVPRTRTYTIRSVDSDRGELSIDVVLHAPAATSPPDRERLPDSEGIAAAWAQRATPGDRLLVQGPGGAYSPRRDTDVHLLVGDESAVPAIARALESLPSTARGVAVIEAENDDDVLALAHPEGLAVTWALRRGEGHDPARLERALLGALEGLDSCSTPGNADQSGHSTCWPSGVVQVFAHGERGSIKALRALFRTHGVPRDLLSISAYWALGRTEDRFQAEKKEPIGQID